MAVQIIKPVDTKLPMNPLTVETEAEIEDDFVWVPLFCCSYTIVSTGIDTDWEADMEV